LLVGGYLFRQSGSNWIFVMLGAVMKRLAIALLAATGLSMGLGQIASAADLPVKAPPMVAAPVPFSWTGFYVGGNVGYSWGRSSSDAILNGLPIFSSSVNVDGVIGGGQIGYNWQTGNFVLGLETDIQASGQSGNATVSWTIPVAGAPGIPVTEPYTAKLTYFGTVRGRVGYAVDRWLLYATGGWAYGHETQNGSATAAGVTSSFSYSTDRSGWTLGGGVEMALNRNWSWKAEYLYIDLGTWNLTVINALGTATTATKFTDNIFRLGVNYRF
jgi:outer membrane immunogenic protein